MKEVVDILEKADLNDDAQRVKAFQAARGKSREILVRIQVEQQILLRRLKIAELARQIQQLIEHQTKVRKETEAVPGEPADRRHGTEPGRPGRPARRDRQLRAVQAEPAADEPLLRRRGPGSRRGHADGGKAADRRTAGQGRDGPSRRRIHGRGRQPKGDHRRLGGPLAEDPPPAENDGRRIPWKQKIAEALKKQEEIREASAKKPLEPEAADKLAAQQDELAKKIDELSASAKPEVRAALEQAKQEAQEAANSLLEQKQPEALAHQDKAAMDLKAAAHEAEKSQPASEPNSPRPPRTPSGRNWKTRSTNWPLPPRSWKRPPQTERQIAKDANQAAREARAEVRPGRGPREEERGGHRERQGARRKKWQTPCPKPTKK